MRFLLDTVTISEFRRKARVHPQVRMWQERVKVAWLSVITLNELRYSIKKVEPPDPTFGGQLSAWYAQILANPEKFRILNVDRPIAELAADFRVVHNIPFKDSLIAATAKVHNLTIATRNTSHFEACGVEMVNPWEYGA